MSRKILIIGIVLISAVVAGVYLFRAIGLPPSEKLSPVQPKADNTEEEQEDLVTPPSTPPEADDTGATQEGVESLVEANNQFALDFYANLKDKEAGKNIFFSPYSISTALTMTYEGARGETASEIKSVFRFPKDDKVRRSSVAAVHNRLNKKDAGYKLHTANALWAQESYQLRNEFTEAVENFYGGKVTSLDFTNATEESRKMINSWVEDKTNNKIKNLFPRNSLSSQTRLVLTNAIYFKGDWVKQFEKSNTRDEDFRVSQTQEVKVPMMRRAGSGSEFSYAETDTLQILEMLYEGEELSMLVLLPKNDDLVSLDDSLTVENLAQWRNRLEKQRVDVYMPKFTFDSKYSLNENLKEMGMPLAFTPPSPEEGADFSGISGRRDLYIDLVVHQAFVDVNEEGTEATAATGVEGGATSVGPMVPVFRADHPFIFLIQEKETGNILFMGKVANPAT